MAKWMNVAQIKEKIEESSAEEVTAHYLEVIKKNKINGYITVSEKALEQAKKIDAEGHNGPLAGVPIAIKDNISVAGLPNSCGSKILENYIPPFNAHVIEKLLAAGAVILGKTNMDEFAMGSSTETSYFGPTANPGILKECQADHPEAAQPSLQQDKPPLPLVQTQADQYAVLRHSAELLGLSLRTEPFPGTE